MGDQSCEGLAQVRFLLTQVFTGASPFGNLEPIMVMAAIIRGGRPQRPNHPGISDSLWELIQRCWDRSPSKRPEASEVSEVLPALSIFRSLCQPSVC